MPGRLRWGATALLPVLLGALTILLQEAQGVTMFDDELGFLGQAVDLSSRSGHPGLQGLPFYSAGYPLLLAGPISLVDVDPWVVAVAVNLTLLALLGPLLYAIVRRAVPVTDTIAAVAAIAGASVPSVVMQTPRAWSEVALAVGMTLWALVLMRFLDRPGPWRAVVLGAAAGVAFSLHRRSLALVAVTVVMIAVQVVLTARRDGLLAAARIKVAGLVATAVSVIAAVTLDRREVDRLYRGLTSGDRLDKLAVLETWDWLPTLLGHTWSALATTFGLVGVGLLVVISMAWRGSRRAWSVALVVTFGGLVMTSVVFLGAGSRVDQTVYERYMAPMFPVLVAVGIAGLATGARSVRVMGVGATVALAASGIALDAAVGGTRLVGHVQKFTVPTLSGFEIVVSGWDRVYPSALHALPITAISWSVAAVVVLAGRWPRSVAPLAVVAFVACSAVTSAGSLRAFADEWEPTGRPIAAILRARGSEVLLVAPRTPNEVRNVVQYRLDYPELRMVDPERQQTCPDETLLIGPPGLDRSVRGVELIAAVGTFPGGLYALGCNPIL